MLRFGVTGGIGAGKSAVCDLLRRKGVPVLEADLIARDLTNTSPQIRTSLIKRFGSEVYTSDGVLNAPLLGEVLFKDADARRRVNEIVHPVVLEFVRKRIREYESEGEALLAVEAALIFESGMQRDLDLVIVVDAPVWQRIARVQVRNNLSRKEIVQRMRAQMPVAEKVKRADYVLCNDASLAHLSNRVNDLHHWLSQRVKQRATTSQ